MFKNAVTVIPSGTYTTTQTSAGFNGMQVKGVKVVLNISAITAGTFTLHIQGIDDISANTYDILVGSGETATGTYVYTVYPSITVTANATASDVLPNNWQITVVPSGTTPSATYSVSATVIE